MRPPPPPPPTHQPEIKLAPIAMDVFNQSNWFAAAEGLGVGTTGHWEPLKMRVIFIFKGTVAREFFLTETVGV